MDKDPESHPSARLVSIGKPTFWIYWIVCLVIYIANYVIANKSPDKLRTAGPSAAIFVCVFLALILNIIEASVAKPQIKKNLTLFNNVFMIASVIAIIIWIIIK